MEQAKLNRLKKYKAWLEHEDTKVYYAGDKYKIINDLIESNSIPDYCKKVLNEIEADYQKYKTK